MAQEDNSIKDIVKGIISGFNQMSFQQQSGLIQELTYLHTSKLTEMRDRLLKEIEERKLLLADVKNMLGPLSINDEVYDEAKYIRKSEINTGFNKPFAR